MVVRSVAKCAEITAGDRCQLRELLHPGKDALALRYSLAWARVGCGAATVPHVLRSSEVYYVLQGEGRMHIDDEQALVHPGDAIYIPPGARQHIENTGKDELVFLCIVDPAWRPEDETILNEQ
ncbi:MAG: cupin domain-containing protein [bacterium]|nr:cupin domain-containing protein [bacterium]